jgi:hypothetical protein
MSNNRSRMLLLLGVIAFGATLVALRADVEVFERLNVRHVHQTVFISAGNRRLARFFDGMEPDPRWDARKELQRARARRGCAPKGGGGVFSRLAAFLIPTAYAQGGCLGWCNGCYSSIARGACSLPSCSGSQSWAVPSDDQCSGTIATLSSCLGTCTLDCNETICDDSSSCGCGGGGGGGCVSDGQSCSSPTDCCSGTCVDGTCGSSQ